MEHRITFRVYYEDTDSLGVVYYANYLKYLERGRSEAIEAAGRTVKEWNDAGFLFVVHSVNLTYRRSLALGDYFDVVTSLALESPYRARFHQRVEKDAQKVVTGTVDIACLDANSQLIEFPKDLLDHA